MAITNEQQAQILKVVVGLFNGGISAGNLSKLANLVEGGMSIAALSDALASTSVFKDKILAGKTTIESQVNLLMDNFGVAADSDPQSAGSKAELFFTARISNGAGLGSIVNEATTFLSRSDLPAQFAEVAALLNNKVLVAEEYAGRNPPNDFATMIALFGDVTAANPATKEDAIAFVDNFITGPITENKISLTTSVDDLVGTSGIDVFSGVFDSAGTSTTISTADVLDGAGGTDILNIRIASISTQVVNTISPVSSNIENFFLTNQAKATNSPFVLNFINISDEVEVWDKGSVSNAQTLAFNVDPTATAGMADTLGLFYGVNFSGESGRSGSSDAFTLALTGAGTAAQQVLFSTVTTAGTIDNSFEVANISSSATLSNVNLGGLGSMALKTVNVSGDAVLMLSGDDDFAGLSAVDASQMTAGGLNIDARGSEEGSFNFTGSPVDDRIVLKNSAINTAGSLDGGEGNDTLATQNFNNLNTTAVNTSSGFEVLEGVGGAENINTASFTGISEFLFTGTTGQNNGFDIGNIESNDRVAYSTDILSGGNYALRLSGKNTGTTALIELRAVSETDGETVFTATSNNNDRYGIEIQSNVASLKLDSTGTSTNANVIETSQANNDYFGYAFGNLTTPVFNITGSHDLVIMAREGVDISDGTKLAGFSNAANIDATTFSGILRIAGSLSDDVIKGGSGDDIIYGLGGDDTLTGNDGADQFRLAEYYNTTDTIIDFVRGTDKVGLNQFDFGNTTATQAGAALSTTDYVENRSGITSIGNADAKKVIELQTSLDGGQIATDTGAAIEAYVLVHNTTSGKGELWYDDNWSDADNRSHIVTYDNVVDLTGVKSFSNSDFVEYTY